MAARPAKEEPPAARSRLSNLLRSPWLWMVAVAAIVTVIVVLVRARGPRVPTAVVARRDLEQHLVATGRVLAPARVDVAALSMGLVRAVAVREGDRVKADDLLVQLDDAEAKAAVLLAEAAVAQAAARAEKVTHVNALVTVQAVAQADANLQNAQEKYDRTKKLYDTGSLTQQDLDEATRLLKVSKAQKDTSAAQLAGSGVDAREAWAGLRQAQAQLVSAKVRLAQTRIVALADGIVLTRDVEPGTVATPARTLLVLSLSGAARLVLQPDERDLSLIQLGLKARASADAYPNEAFDAEVTYMAPSVDVTRGTIEVRLRVPSPPAYLRPDMTVSVDLVVATRKQTLVVRSDAIRGLATPNPWLLVVLGDRTARRDLRLGIRGEGSVEVLGGLSEGEVVVLPDGQTLVPGQRVRPFRKDP